MKEADLVIGNKEYDEEEIDRRRTLVLKNPHLYLTKKKKSERCCNYCLQEV
jgi:hypothetical protein